MSLHSTRWLALGYFTYFFSYGIFLPFWSVWLKGLGLTPETIGLLLGAGLVARFLGSLIIAPRVSDPSRLISALRILALLTLIFAPLLLAAGAAHGRAGEYLAKADHHGLWTGASVGIGRVCDWFGANRQTGQPV